MRNELKKAQKNKADIGSEVRKSILELGNDLKMRKVTKKVTNSKKF